jgi:hypothetical protein
VARVRKEILKQLTPIEKDHVIRAVKQLDARGGKVDLAAWARSVEMTANRAGLVLCADLRVAMRLIKAEARNIADVSADDRRGSLLAFLASEKLAKLRERLQITARPSTVPPPPASVRPIDQGRG